MLPSDGLLLRAFLLRYDGRQLKHFFSLLPNVQLLDWDNNIFLRHLPIHPATNLCVQDFMSTEDLEGNDKPAYELSLLDS